jgi:hypothetical protein
VGADPLHALRHRSEVQVAVDPAVLLAHLDDHRRLSAHLERSSLMTVGASMRIDTDERHGQAVGAVIRPGGCVLGLRLSVDEVVTEREPLHRKVWETMGEPKLLFVGAYRMGFTSIPSPTARAWSLSSTTTSRLAASGAGSVPCWAEATPPGVRVGCQRPLRTPSGGGARQVRRGVRQARKGPVMAWRFDASGPLNVNIHDHEGTDVHCPGAPRCPRQRQRPATPLHALRLRCGRLDPGQDTAAADA